ncbi:hypothetical protein BH09BAC1_BH09BAC1_29130 [soil metagenome]
MKNILLAILLILSGGSVLAQTRTFPPRGYAVLLKAGPYTSKSNSFYIASPKILKPQTQVDSLHNGIGYMGNYDGTLTLFNTSNPTTASDVAGILIGMSLIEICNVEHRSTFEGTRGISYTYEVWYTILLNGRQYFTDVKPNKLEFQTAYPVKKQRFALFNRNTGYDGNYDMGYPEFFQVLVFDESASPMKLIFDSAVLPFKNGNEFWGSDNTGDLKTTITSKGLEFQLVGFETDYKATWNGKALVDVKVVDID